MLVHECLVGAAETAAPPKRVAWVWQDAIPSYNYLITFFATFVPSAAIVVFTNTPFAGR